MAVTRTDRNQEFRNGLLVHEEVVVVDVTAETNAPILRQQVAQALAGLQAVIDTANLPAGSLTAAQLSGAARQLQDAAKLQARVLRRLIRLAVEDYEVTD